MANLYVVEDIGSFSGPVPAGFTLTDASSVTITEPSVILIDGGRSASLSVQDSFLNFVDHPVTVRFADDASGPVNSAELSFGDNIRPTVEVASGQDVSQWTIAAGRSEGLTLTADDGASLGQVAGAESAFVTDTITLGDNVTVSATAATGPGAANRQGAIDVNNGADSITLGNNVTVEGTIYLEGTGDQLIAGDGLTITADGEGSGGGIDGALNGSKTIQIGNGATIAADIRLGGGSDTLTFGDAANVSGDITLGGGQNTLAAGDDVTFNAVSGGHGQDIIRIGDRFGLRDEIQLWGGADQITIGDDMRALGAQVEIEGGTGNDIFEIGRINIDEPIRFDGEGGSNSITFTRGAVDSTGASRTADLLAALNQSAAVGGGRVNDINEGQNSTPISDGRIVIDDFCGFTVICFAKGTRILTRNGEVPVEQLAVGDELWTRDNGFQPLRWIGQRRLGPDDLTRAPHLRPIRLRAGALGRAPLRDLVVSPQHRLLVRSKIAARMVAPEVLVAAKQLLALPGVEVSDQPEVTYFHLLTDAHDILLADGAEAESLYPGPEALKSLTPQGRAEVLALFPEAHAPARPFVRGAKARTMAARHVKNDQALIA